MRDMPETPAPRSRFGDPQVLVLVFAVGFAVGGLVSTVLESVLKPPCPCQQEGSRGRGRRGKGLGGLAENNQLGGLHGHHVMDGMGDVPAVADSGKDVVGSGPVSPESADPQAAGNISNGVGDMADSSGNGGGVQ